MLPVKKCKFSGENQNYGKFVQQQWALRLPDTKDFSYEMLGILVNVTGFFFILTFEEKLHNSLS